MCTTLESSRKLFRTSISITLSCAPESEWVSKPQMVSGSTSATSLSLLQNYFSSAPYSSAYIPYDTRLLLQGAVCLALTAVTTAHKNILDKSKMQSLGTVLLTMQPQQESASVGRVFNQFPLWLSCCSSNVDST